ncbi:hypothetical protein HDU86_007730 [Geranomyces michiganensis]|nr:hypothetical protein HDU86_007730 [Geranomyces michiganensis]
MVPPWDLRLFPRNSAPPLPHSKGTLVVYVYYDGKMTNADSAVRESWGSRDGVTFSKQQINPPQTDNLKFFLRHGLLDNVDHLFVMNSPIPEGVVFPNRTNIFVWEKSNECYDLGSFHMGVTYMTTTHNRTYDKYVLLNASVRGPFLPSHDRSSCWIDHFLSLLSPEVKLVGTTWHCEIFQFPPHMQTQILAMDAAGYEAAIPALQCQPTIEDAIFRGEVPLTGIVQREGYGVRSITTAFGADPDECTQADTNYKGKYYGMSLHPYEVIFIKTNRHIDDLALDRYTTWHDSLLNNEPSGCRHHMPLPEAEKE